MEKNGYFKSVEIVGVNRNAAVESADLGFGIGRDATQAYKNWVKKQGNKAITSKDIKQFKLDYLEKHFKSLPGSGASITIESAVADTRERPWKITDHKNEQGKRKYKTVYKMIDMETGVVLAVNDETKASAKNVAKEIILAHANALAKGAPTNFSGKGRCYYSKDVVEGEPIAFDFEYVPSCNAKSGRWEVFGIAMD